MKNILLGTILLIITVVISSSILLKPKEEIFYNKYDNKELFNSLDYNLNKIKSNMNEITDKSNIFNWAYLKEIQTNDTLLHNFYNSLVQEIRTCYLISSNEENTFSNLKVLDYKNRNNITSDELLKLDKNEFCLDNLEIYNKLTLSDDLTNSERIKRQLNMIISYEKNSSEYKTFEEVLFAETNKIQIIANISEWLKLEYYGNK